VLNTNGMGSHRLGGPLVFLPWAVTATDVNKTQKNNVMRYPWRFDSSAWTNDCHRRLIATSMMSFPADETVNRTSRQIIVH